MIQKMKKTLSGRERRVRREFLIVLVFTFFIPILISFIEMGVKHAWGFKEMAGCLIPNMVPSILAYAVVIVLQNMMKISAKKTDLRIFTILTFMLIITCGIFYAVHLTYKEMSSDGSALWIMISTITLSGVLVVFSVLSFLETMRSAVTKKRRKLSGEDY